jgi:hypothetical protein
MYLRSLLSCLALLALGGVRAQCISYSLDQKGDTLNCVDTAHHKQGRWVVHVDELRGEPGYEEEGVYVNDGKNGIWRRYDLQGDIIAVENYKWGSKDSTQEYFTWAGDRIREENWMSVNPKNPYDTVVVYDDPHNPFKANRRVVKLDASTVKNGTWLYFDPTTGTVAKTERYILGKLQNEFGGTAPQRVDSAGAKPPPEVEQFNKKNSGKKYKLRTGETGG